MRSALKDLVLALVLVLAAMACGLELGDVVALGRPEVGPGSIGLVARAQPTPLRWPRPVARPAWVPPRRASAA